MNIVIDCRMIQSSGIGTFLQGILPYLLTNKKHNFLLVGDKNKLAVYKHSNVEILHSDIQIFSKKEFFSFPVNQINTYDVFFTPNYNIPGGIRIKIISVIHDVVFLDMPKLTSFLGRLIRKQFLKRAIKKSNQIITVSNFSKERIKYYFNTKTAIKVTYNSIKQDLINWNPLSQSPIKDPYIIFIGNFKEHKGIELLINAYLLAKKEGFNKKLVIIGSNKNLKTKLNISFDISSHQIQFLDNLSDNLLYNYIYHADFLVQPSFYEGFGLPPLEALFLNTTVIISDIPVFKELYSDLKNCHFFRTGDINDLKEKLMQTTPLNIEQRQKILQKFSFEQSANIITSLIENC